MIQYQKKFIRIAECWDGEQAPDSGVDLVRLFQRWQALSGMFCRDFCTILIDLRQSKDMLLASMKKDTRYEIRRAADDEFIYQVWDQSAPEALNEFCEYYDQFATHKSQPKQNRSWLSLLAGAGALSLSCVRVKGDAQVWHAYHRAPHRVTLLYSASLFRDSPDSAHRNRIGRANRYHHWQDMMHFKNHEVSTYDFGGWYQGKKDQARLSINKFKEEFGGEIVRNYICERGLTIKGKVFLLTRRLLLGNAI
jgi:hypothetical protein